MPTTERKMESISEARQKSLFNIPEHSKKKGIFSSFCTAGGQRIISDFFSQKKFLMLKIFAI